MPESNNIDFKLRWLTEGRGAEQAIQSIDQMTGGFKTAEQAVSAVNRRVEDLRRQLANIPDAQRRAMGMEGLNAIKGYAGTALPEASKMGMLNTAFVDINDQIDQMQSGLLGVGGATESFGDALVSVSGILQNVAAGAAAFAVTMKQAFELGREGSAIAQTGDSFDHLLKKIGAAPDLLDRMNRALRGTVSELEIMQGTQLILAGLNDDVAKAMSDALPQLALYAKAANKLNPSLGDTSFLLDSITRGIKRNSPLILDNLGIVVKVGEANEKYASSLGKSVNELTAEEKQLALLNAVLEKGETLLDQAGGTAEARTDSFDQLSVAFKELGDAVKEDLYPALSDAAKALELTLTWHKRIQDALKEHEQETAKTAKTYEEYVAETTRAAQAAGYLVDEHGRLFKVMKDGPRVFKEYNDQLLMTRELWDGIRYAMEHPEDSEARYVVRAKVEQLHIEAQSAQISDDALKAYDEYRTALADLERETQEARAAVAEEYTQRLAEIEAEVAQRRADMQREYNERLADIERDRRKAEIEARRNHLKRLREMERDHEMRMNDAIAARDALAVVNEMRRHQQAVQDENERYAEERRKIQERYKEQMADLRRWLDDQKRAIDKYQKEQLERLKAWKDKELSMLEKKYKEQFDKIEKAFKDRLDALDTEILGTYEAYLEHLRSLSDEFKQWIEDQKSSEEGSRQSGGYVWGGNWRLHDGEFVMNPSVTSAFEHALGGRITENRLMNMISGRSGGSIYNNRRGMVNQTIQINGGQSLTATQYRRIAEEAAYSALNSALEGL